MPKFLKKIHFPKLKFERKKTASRPLLFVGIILIAILVGIVSLQQVFKKDASATWWNGDYKYRTRYSFTASSAITSERKIKLDVDTATLIGAGKMQSDCDDVRFTDSAGKILDYFIDDSVADCNNASTDFYIKLPTVASGGNLIYMYYGNSQVTRSDFGGRKNAFFDDTTLGVGLQGYWKLDETANDTCPTANDDLCDSAYDYDHGVIFNPAANNVNGRINKAYSFSGYAPSASDRLDMGTNDWSMSAWIKTTDTDGTIIGKNKAAGSSGDYYIKFSSGDLVGTINYGSGNVSTSGVSGYNDDNWHNVIVTYDRDGNMTLYVDGVSKASTSIAAGSAVNMDHNCNWLFADADTAGCAHGQDIYTGYIDDVRVYKKVLSDTEIAHIQNASEIPTSPTITPSSGPTAASEETTPDPVAYWNFDEGQGQTVNDSTTHNNDGTLGANSSSSSDDPTWKQESDCVSGKCLQFDGSADYVNLDANVSRIDDYTVGSIGFWFKGASTGQSIQALFSISDKDTTSDRFEIILGAGTSAYADESIGIVRADSGTVNYSAWVRKGNTYYYDNKWHYFEYTSGSSSNAIYIDGIPQTLSYENGSSSSNMFLNIANADSSSIGRRNISGFTNYTTGFIDEVKIYPYARSAAEIKADYSAGAAVLGLADQKDYLSDGLVGYWKMDEASANGCTGGTNDSCDSSGNGNDGAWNGDATSIADKFGNGVTLDGTGDYVNFGRITATESQSQMTWSFWTKPTSLPFTKTCVLCKYGSTLTWAITTDDSANTGLRVHIPTTTSDGGTFGRIASGFFTAGTRIHVVVVFDGTQPDNASRLKVYKNGALQTLTFTGTIPTSLISDSSNVTIGGSSTGTMLLPGTFDDVRIYKKALSPSEVGNLVNWAPGPVGYWKMDEGSANTCVGGTNDSCDSSGNGNNGAWNGDITPVNGKYGKAIRFDGTGDYVTISSTTSIPNGSKPRTLMAWFKTNSFPTDTSSGRIFSYTVDGGNGADFAIGVEDNAVHVGFGGHRVITPKSALSTDTWYHVAVVVPEGTTLTSQVTVWLNGVRQTLTDESGSAQTLNTTGTTLSIGSYGTQNLFNGDIDDVKIYNYARTPGQIVEDMNAGHPLGGSPVGSQTMYWKLDEQQESTANDSSSSGSYDGTTSGTVWKTKTDCKVNGCVDIDTSSDLVSAGDVSFVDGLTQMTISMWINPSTLGVNKHIITKHHVSQTSNSFQLRVGATDELDLYIANSLTDSSNNGARTTNFDLTTGTWTHIAVVYDGTQATASNRIKFYKNGLSGITTTAVGTTPTSMTSGSTANLKLGLSDFSAPLTALLAKYDEVKIYNSALTVDQIRADMNTGSAVSYSVLGSSEAADLTDGAGNPPVLDLNFDENTGQSTNDLSGNGNTGTLGASTSVASDDPAWISVTGQPTFGNGVGGNALTFDGSNDLVSIADNSTIEPSSALSISVWLKRNTTGSRQILLGKGAGSTSDSQYWLELNASNQIVFYTSAGGVDRSLTASDLTITDTTNWHHVAGTWNGSTMRAYLDGKASSTTVSTSGTISNYSSQLSIGKLGSWAGSAWFNGHIDSVKIYNYARTPAQVAYDYNRGRPLAHWKLDECQGSTTYNSTGLSNTNGTITIGASGTQTSVGTCASSSTAWGNGATGKYGSSLSFDGTNDYIDTGATATELGIPNGTRQFSISAWFKTSVTGERYIIDNRDGSPSVNISVRVDNGAIETDIRSASGNDGTTQAGSGYNNGQWHHVVVIWDTATLSIYVDGKIISSTAETITGSFESGSNFWIGQRPSADVAYFNGQIDDVRIYNYALSASQVKKLHNEDGAVRFGQ